MRAKYVFDTTDPCDLAHSRKLKALNAVYVTKEKRDNSLEGRTCANSKKQKEWKIKAEHRSLAVHDDYTMLTSIIGAREEIDADTCESLKISQV